MLRLNRQFVFSILLILTVIFNLMNVNIALADDSTPPPPPTEEPTQPPVEPTEPPVEPLVATPLLEATPENLETAPPEDVPTSAPEEETEVSDLVEQLPENSELVVLDENSQVVPLASQEAAEIIVEADPMWCPAGILPNGPGCTTNLTISALLALMQTNAGGQFNTNGVIYFERSGLTTYTTSFILDDSASSLGASYSTISLHNITLQGGWNGGATSTFSGTESSLFDNNNNVVIRVGSSSNPWVGNVTIQDVEVQDNDGNPGPVNGAGLSAYTTTGNISLNDVDVDEQADGQYTAYLSSTSGNILVTNGSSFDGAGNNQGFYASTTTGSIAITGISGNRITFTDALGSGTGTNYNGATLSAPIVSLTYVTSSGNDLNGIVISNTNQVTLNNVNATNNGTDIAPSGFTGNLGSGVLINGNAGSFVSVLGGNFSLNQRYGVEYYNSSVFVGTLPICLLNDGGCTNTPATLDFTPPTITFLSRTPANGSGWNNTNVTITWSCSDAGSGVVSPTVSVVVTAEGTNQSATGTCTNRAGLTASNTQTGINIDKTAPTANASASPAPNANGWNNTNVTVTFSGTDERSGIASCTAPVILGTDGANQFASGTCADNAGNVSALASANGIDIDKTAPTATASASPAPNVNGWNNTAVTVSFSGTDALSGVDFCDADVILSSEGAGQSATGDCTDEAGNVSTPATASNINIDLTQPTLNLPADITAEATGPSGAVVNFTASANDNLDPSPTMSCTSASGSTFLLGTTLVTCTATDDAGNSRPGSFNITVQDTTPPALSLPLNMTVEATGPSGAVVSFSATATDLVDGARIVTCVPPSGSTFGITTTIVNCSASDTRGNTANGSFTVTVQDTTPPTISPMANLLVHTTNGLGEPVNYTAPTTSDVVDGAGIATCSPVSGSLFAPGNTTVTCAATDSHGNTASISFNVHANLLSAQNQSVFGGFILITGGELIDLDCSTVANVFGVIVKFHNLCNHQAVLNEVTENSLPGALPNGFTFVKGLDVDVLSNGQSLQSLPNGAGVEMDFPVSDGANYVVLYWNNRQWVEITQPMNAADLTSILNADPENELYKMSSSNSAFNNVLTTETTGIFVLVKK